MPGQLTTSEKHAFERDGVLRLQGFYSRELVSPMTDAIWSDLRVRHGVERERSETWTLVRPTGFQSLGRSGVFQPLNSTDLSALASDLAGAGDWRAGGHAVPLVTFPTGGWTVPTSGWHIDSPAVARQGDAATIGTLRLFVILAPVAPRGGGTLFVSGAHRLLLGLADKMKRDLSSARSRDRLKRTSPWFEALWDEWATDRLARLIDGADVGGLPLRLGEMTGEVGDLIVMHPNVLHAAAPNASQSARMVLTQTLMRGRT